jgi:hypothetical protein
MSESRAFELGRRSYGHMRKHASGPRDRSVGRSVARAAAAEAYSASADRDAFVAGWIAARDEDRSADIKRGGMPPLLPLTPAWDD